MKQLKVVGIGPQKTGTTWLDMCLREHPQLCFPRGTKETFFLNERFDKGWSWYWRHFKHYLDTQFCAEIGPSYFDVPEVAERLYQHNPECRIIVNLRDPVARSFSLYLHHKSKGRLKSNFLTSIQQMPRIIESSYYRVHLSRWIDMFGREKILIILLEDIVNSHEKVLEQIHKFIGINNISAPQIARERINEAVYTPFPSFARLIDFYASHLRNKQLYSCINLMKKFGLKNIYSRSYKNIPILEPEIRKSLIEKFETDIAFVEELLGRQLLEWRRY
jgi:hypothetical protein